MKSAPALFATTVVLYVYNVHIYFGDVNIYSIFMYTVSFAQCTYILTFHVLIFSQLIFLRVGSAYHCQVHVFIHSLCGGHMMGKSLCCWCENCDATLRVGCTTHVVQLSFVVALPAIGASSMESLGCAAISHKR